jgi:SAM-dependent methyltransferase
VYEIEVQVTVSELPGWAPEGVDVTVPNAARVYDYAIGGVHNFAVDREFWHQTEKFMPDAALVGRANRAFLGRAVRYLAESGIRQFLDIGSGIPTLGNVHEAAQGIIPDARVMYVDIDPIAVQQSRTLLGDNPYASVIQGDLRDPGGILNHDEVQRLLDFAEPIGVLTVAVLHFLPDSDGPDKIIRQIGDAVVAGSHLVLSHFAPDENRRQAQEGAAKMYEQTPTPVLMRDRAQLAALLGPFEPVEPGIVIATDWRPDPGADEAPQPSALVAVARKS